MSERAFTPRLNFRKHQHSIYNRDYQSQQVVNANVYTQDGYHESGLRNNNCEADTKILS
jgi:hypothetical protein